jgi:serine/threonine-protein kinase
MVATPRGDGDDQPARIIGRYELVSEIAPGALGELWKARIVSGPEQGRIVSIRRVRRTGALDARAVERLTNAGFAAMEVRHPKIGAVLDVVVADSEIALVSEHIGGALLATLLHPPTGKRPNVSPDVALRIVLDVLEAVDAVHGQWRDLFPSADSEEERLLGAAAHGGLVPDSVLLASFGEAMLLDAGLAGVAMTMPAIVEHADVIAYRAPEQLQAGGVADERSDVFTVGIFVWELLAGRPLFAPAVMPRPVASGPAIKTKAFSDAMQVSTVKRKVLTAPIQRLDSLPLLRGKVSKAFSDVVAKCLERDPAKRFQSVREFIAAVSKLGPKTVASYDAVSKLLASVGAAAPAEENPIEPSSGRSTSNRPTVPPEKGADRESVPPDTKRAQVPGAAAGSFDVTPEQRAKVEPLEEDRRTAPVDSVEEALSAADFQSIPPTSDVESIPSATDVESLPPSADSRVTSPNAPSSDGISVDVASSSPATGPNKAVAALAPFTPALAPPYDPAAARAEETTSAPVVRPLSSEGGADLTSTLMSSRSGRGANKKIIIGAVAAVGLIALIALIRAATSSAPAESVRLSASAGASVTPPIPSAAESPSPSAAAEAPTPPPTSEPTQAVEPAAGESPPPTSAPEPAPAGAGVQPVKRQQLPAKKKPFRPSGI